MPLCDLQAIFLKPFWEHVVDGLKVCPDYTETIQHPICIEIIEEKAKKSQYKTVRDFVEDVCESVH